MFRISIFECVHCVDDRWIFNFEGASFQMEQGFFCIESTRLVR